MMSIATITSKGQVTIPKGVRTILGLKTGDKIDFTVNPDGSVLVRPCFTDLDDVQGILKVDKKVEIHEMDRAVAAFHRKVREVK